jgi:iron complex transport system ATP-binding protein
LSGGERQRALLAAAIAQETPLLALDEPSAHADPPLQAAIFELLAQRAAAGLAVLAAVHDINLALTYATRALVLVDGQLAFDGTVKGFTASAQFTRVFGPRFSVHQIDNHPVVTHSRRGV